MNLQFADLVVMSRLLEDPCGISVLLFRSKGRVGVALC